MSKIIRQSKILPILLLLLFILVSAYSAITIVNADSKFHDIRNIWNGVNTSVTASPNDFPYNASALAYEDAGGKKVASNTAEEEAKKGAAKNASVNSVSMDILFGIKKSLVMFHGELPYNQLHTGEDGDDVKTIDGWSGYPTIDGTSMSTDKDEHYTNPNFGAKASPSQVDYWGTTYSDSNFDTYQDAESCVENDTELSLRLYANTQTHSDFAEFFENLFYVIFQFFAWLASMFITLIIYAKNISMDFILEALKLDDLSDLVTKTFIYNDKIGLTPFTAFCLIMLIFALIGYAIRWVKGAEKTRGLWSIVGTALLGLLIVAIALTGHIGELGSTVANGATKVMAAVSSSLSNSNEGEAFVVDVDIEHHDNEILQLQELALIYKPYIDTQICTQFGITNIDDIKFENLGDTDCKNAVNYLAGIPNNANADYMKSNFNGNLGYYFWFADSNVAEKTNKNSTYPTLKAGSAEDKLNSMITYLQVQHHSSESNKTKIRTIIDNFADNDSMRGALCMILLTAILILLAIVLLKYALNVLISKIGLFVALLGLAIAGPLIVSNKDKLVKTGKSIIGMLLVCFIEITVWSIFFDMIIYTVATLLTSKIGDMLVTVAFLLLFLKFNPVIAEKVKKMLDDSTRAMCPTYHQSRNAFKQYLKRSVNKAKQANDDRKVYAGTDANGNPIYKTAKGGIISKTLAFAANSMESPQSRKSARRIRKEENVKAHSESTEAIGKMRKAAVDKTKAVETAIESTQKQIVSDFDKEVAANTAAYQTVDQFGHTVFDQAKLAAIANTSKVRHDKIAVLMAHIEANNKEIVEIKSGPEYQRLLAKLNTGETLTGQDAADWNRLNSRINSLESSSALDSSNITNIIKEQEMKAVASSRKISVDDSITDINQIRQEVEHGAKIVAQNEHKEDYEKALKAEQETHALDTYNTTGNGKIGSTKSTTNKEAVESQAVAALKLQQLEEGTVVQSTEEAKQSVQGIVEAVEKRESAKITDHLKHPVKHAAKDLHAAKNAVRTGDETAEEKAKKNAYKQESLFSKSRKKAKQEYKDLKESNSELVKESKQGYKDAGKQAKHDVDKRVRSATVTEFINSSVKNVDQINTVEQLSRKNAKMLDEIKKAEERLKKQPNADVQSKENLERTTKEMTQTTVVNNTFVQNTTDVHQNTTNVQQNVTNVQQQNVTNVQQDNITNVQQNVTNVQQNVTAAGVIKDVEAKAASNTPKVNTGDTSRLDSTIDRHVTGSELTEKDVDKLVKSIKADLTTQYDERDKVARKLEKDIKNESDVVTQHELEQKLAEVRAEMAEIDDARSNTQMRVTQRLEGSKMTISESGKFKSDD